MVSLDLDSRLSNGKDCVPLTRITANAALPGGVDKAKIVSGISALDFSLQT